MLKHIYRVIILVCVFLAGTYYFSLGMIEQVFTQVKTVEMSQTSFPTVTAKKENMEINLLHGYSNNMNVSLFQESVIPLEEGQNFLLSIKEYENDVKRVIIELRDVDDNKLIETDTINALEKEDDYKIANIRIKTQLELNKEYNIKATLITSESRKVNYYTRVKRIDDSKLDMKLNFVMNLHSSLMKKEEAEAVKSYFEPKNTSDNTTFAKVNIKSSFDLVSYGNLNPKVISNIVPTVTDITKEMGMFSLQYVMEVETDTGVERYNVKENFRVRFTLQRMFLLNYDRTMESIFDINNISLKENELKLGITNNPESQITTSDNNKKIAFVRERELWYYDTISNEAVKVFSFRQEQTDYIRDNYDKHEVKILSMDDLGNIHFMVYGYMNRGAYEGKVGTLLYEYNQEDNRIEELVYIPTNVPYDILKEEIKDFSYVSGSDIFYFALSNQILSFDMITKQVNVIQDKVSQEGFEYLSQIQYIAFLTDSNIYESKEVKVMDLSTGLTKTITGENSSNIRLLGKINNNLVLGYYNTLDIATYLDGKVITPMYEVAIVDIEGNILKDYKREGYYISDISVNKNVVTLERMTKSEESGKVVYTSITSDNILNKLEVEEQVVGVNTRITEKTKKEFYLFLPKTTKLSSKPSVDVTVNTVIRGDTTLRIENEASGEYNYIVYAYGDVKGTFDTLGDAIVSATETVGSVYDHKGTLLWEKKIRSDTLEITGITMERGNSQKAASTMLVNHRFGEYGESGLEFTQMYDYLSNSLDNELLNLSGALLTDVLYYVSLKRPVVAMKNEKDAVLIIGYDPYNITVMDPALNRTMKVGFNDGTAMFKEAGNIFYTYQGK